MPRSFKDPRVRSYGIRKIKQLRTEIAATRPQCPLKHGPGFLQDAFQAIDVRNMADRVSASQPVLLLAVEPGSLTVELASDGLIALVPSLRTVIGRFNRCRSGFLPCMHFYAAGIVQAFAFFMHQQHQTALSRTPSRYRSAMRMTTTALSGLIRVSFPYVGTGIESSDRNYARINEKRGERPNSN